MVKAALLALLLLAGACAPLPRGPLTALAAREIHRDTLWSGRVVIDGSVKVFKGATLTIAPGSEILFVRRDTDKDGLGDGTLIVEGRLLAIGTRSAPIVFRSAASEPQPGDWLEIRVDFSREAHLRYCDIRDSAHTLHAHFTRAVLEDSHIHHNLDGCRLGQGSFLLQRNLIEDNEGKGINFRNATVEIRNNIIRRNGSGIFLFETDRPPRIEHNNLYANGDNLRLGDFFQTDLILGENWWGSAVPEAVAASIYDHAEDASLGRVTVGIAPAWLAGSGPQDAVALRETRQVPSAGFIDAPPLPLGAELLMASWDGTLQRVTVNGELRWQQTLGDVIDAPLVSDGVRIFGQSWGREVFALAADDGRKLWSFRYPASPADDHRQGGVVLSGELLLVPAWNGTLYALDAASGAERWQLVTPGPLRAAPSVTGERIYLPGGDGVVRCLDQHGKLLWSWSGQAPLLTTVALSAIGPVVLDRNGTVTALDATGQVRWQRLLAETCYYAAPLVAGPALYVATAGGSLWQLDVASGATIWQRSGLGAVYATPLLDNGRLLVGDNDGNLTVWGAASGEPLASLKVAGAIQGGPVRFANGYAFGSRDHQLHLCELLDLAEAP